MSNFLQLRTTSSLLRPNILLGTPFPTSLNLCPYLNATGQVSHPYKTTDKIIVSCICNLFERRREG
jgi:hypothetical protein